MNPSKRIETALTILCWDKKKYDLAKESKNLNSELSNEIKNRMIKSSTGECNPITRNEQWAYGVLFSDQ